MTGCGWDGGVIRCGLIWVRGTGLAAALHFSVRKSMVTDAKSFSL